MQMNMTADEARDFMRKLHRHCLDPDFEAHADYIGFIVGETYRDRMTSGATAYRCIHRTARYATFEAVDPWTGETVQFRRKLRVCGDGEPTAWIGYIEDCKSPFGDCAPEYICATNIDC